MTNLRDIILSADDTTSEVVEVPQWGDVKIEVRGMTGRDRAAFLSSYTDPDTGRVNWSMLYPSLITASAFDPDTGERIFNDEDGDAINGKSGAALEKVAQVALRLSGMQQEDEDKVGKSS